MVGELCNEYLEIMQEICCDAPGIVAGRVDDTQVALGVDQEDRSGVQQSLSMGLPMRLGVIVNFRDEGLPGGQFDEQE